MQVPMPLQVEASVSVEFEQVDEPQLDPAA
jgi:hypothetical protein